MNVLQPQYGNGYAPPPQGFAPPPQGLHGYQPNQGYAPPAQPHQAFVTTQQPTAGVFVISNQQTSIAAQPAIHTVIHERPRERTNHLVHLVITLLFWPWLFVWIVICIVDGV